VTLTGPRKHFPDRIPSAVDWTVAQVQREVHRHDGRYLLMQLNPITWAVVTSDGEEISRFIIESINPAGTLRIQRSWPPLRANGERTNGERTRVEFNATIDPRPDDYVLSDLAQHVAQELADHRAGHERRRLTPLED
jgi:hypothetical protein